MAPKGFNAVEFGHLDEKAEGRPSGTAAIRTGEQMILAAECNGTDRTLDNVGVDLDAAVIEEQAEGGPAGKGIADAVGKNAARGDA